MVQSIRKRRDEHTLRPQGQANGMGEGGFHEQRVSGRNCGGLLKQQKGLCAAPEVCWRLCDIHEHS